MPGNVVHPTTVRRNFSVHAGSYDRHAVVQQRVAQKVVRQLRRCPELSLARVLDVGMGTGALARELRRHFSAPDCLVGCDHALNMCVAGGQQVPGLLPVVADAQHLPFRTASFSLVLSSSVYQWMNCLQTAFDEAWRVLAPGGWFVFSLFGEKTLYELKESYRRARQALSMPVANHLQSFPTIESVKTLLQERDTASLTLCRGQEVEYHTDVPTVLRRLKGIGAANAARSRPKGLANRRLMKEMMMHYQAAYGTKDGIPASYDVIYASAQKKG